MLFESSWRLKHPSVVFKFRNQVFKLFRGKKTRHMPIKGFRYKKPLAGMDCIATIADEPLYPNEVAMTALIYLGCLSWEHKTKIVPRSPAGFGTSLKISPDLRELKQLTFSRRNYWANTEFLEIDQIPHCSSEEHLTAIGLYREAMITDSPYYKLLCFWNILSIRGSIQTSGWINKALRKRLPSHIFSPSEIKEIKSNYLMGVHFEKNFKDAVSHVKRKEPSDSNTMDVNDPRDFTKFFIGAAILEKLARFYVENDLGMNQKLYLHPGRIKEYKLVSHELDLEKF